MFYLSCANCGVVVNPWTVKREHRYDPDEGTEMPTDNILCPVCKAKIFFSPFTSSKEKKA